MLEAQCTLRAVYGNIDDGQMRRRFPLDQRFDCAGLDVWMTHIGGYPGRYQKRVWAQMKDSPPKLFISGHSHILKVIYDKQFDCLHMNPGACGHHGFHKVRTMIKFVVQDGVPKDLRIIELGLRGRLV
jgi:predicted phosphodiesterase